MRATDDAGPGALGRSFRSDITVFSALFRSLNFTTRIAIFRAQAGTWSKEMR